MMSETRKADFYYAYSECESIYVVMRSDEHYDSVLVSFKKLEEAKKFVEGNEDYYIIETKLR